MKRQIPPTPFVEGGVRKNRRQMDPMPFYVVLNLVLAGVLALMVFAPDGEPQSRLTPNLGRHTGLPLLGEACYERYHLNGLIETGYDQDADDKADWITLHRTGQDQRPLQDALFYALDTNGDGLWEQVWVDIDEDGWNGNEKVYESQSHPFTGRRGHERRME